MTEQPQRREDDEPPPPDEQPPLRRRADRFKVELVDAVIALLRWLVALGKGFGK